MNRIWCISAILAAITGFGGTAEGRHPHHSPHHPHRPHGPVVRVLVVGHPAPPPVVVAEPVVVERTVVVREPAPVVVEEPAPTVVREAEPAPVTKSDVLSGAYFENQKNRMNDLIRSESPTVRAMAAEGLADQTPIIAALIDALINDAESQVRGAAARSLGRLANPIAWAALKQSAKYDEEEAVRGESENAAKRIESLGAERPEESALPMNTGDEKLAEYMTDLRYGNADDRADAAEDLDNEKGMQAVAALINAVVNDKDAKVRREAAASLGKIGDRMAVPFLQKAAACETTEKTKKEMNKAIDRIREQIPTPAPAPSPAG